MEVEPIDNDKKQGEEKTATSTESSTEELTDIVITLKYNSDIEDYECKTRDGIFECENPEPVKTVYTFVGWFTDYDIENTLTSTFIESMTPHAKWKANTYKITFNTNGGNGVEYPILEATYDESMPELSSIFQPKRKIALWDGMIAKVKSIIMLMEHQQLTLIRMEILYYMQAERKKTS